MEPECGNNNDQNNPHQNFLKGTVLEDKEIGLGIKDKGQGIRVKGHGSWVGVVGQGSKVKG